jgi:hypothetical protein
MRRSFAVWVLVAGSSVSACGNGSGSTSTGTHVSWKEDGVAVTAIGGTATFSTSGGRDALEIIGITTSVGVTVFVTAPAPIGPQTFVCNQTTTGQSVGVSYSDADGGMYLTTQSCTVVLTQVGARAAGTFEAVLANASGGTKSITNGNFDLPVK